jgi:hypothetical protein
LTSSVASEDQAARFNPPLSKVNVPGETVVGIAALDEALVTMPDGRLYPRDPYGFFGVWYSASFWSGFQTVS